MENNKQMNLTLICKCKYCGEQTEINVNDEDFYNWRSGLLIQRAFPYLNSGQRELIMSGTCSNCWESIMSEDIDNDSELE